MKQIKDSIKLQRAMHAKQQTSMDQDFEEDDCRRCVLHTCLLLTVALPAVMAWHKTDAVSGQGVTHLGLPSTKVWVSILVVPHQCTLLHIKVAAIGGLSIHLHHPIVHEA